MIYRVYCVHSRVPRHELLRLPIITNSIRDWCNDLPCALYSTHKYRITNSTPKYHITNSTPKYHITNSIRSRIQTKTGWSDVLVQQSTLDLLYALYSVCRFSSNTSLSHACRQVFLLQCVAACCGVLRCVAVSRILLQYVAVNCLFSSNTSLSHACRQVYLLQRVAFCCSVLWCVVVWCILL